MPLFPRTYSIDVGISRTPPAQRPLLLSFKVIGAALVLHSSLCFKRCCTLAVVIVAPV